MISHSYKVGGNTCKVAAVGIEKVGGETGETGNIRTVSRTGTAVCRTEVTGTIDEVRISNQ